MRNSSELTTKEQDLYKEFLVLQTMQNAPDRFDEASVTAQTRIVDALQAELHTMKAADSEQPLIS